MYRVRACMRSTARGIPIFISLKLVIPLMAPPQSDRYPLFECLRLKVLLYSRADLSVQLCATRGQGAGLTTLWPRTNPPALV